MITIENKGNNSSVENLSDDIIDSNYLNVPDDTRGDGHSSGTGDEQGGPNYETDQTRIRMNSTPNVITFEIKGTYPNGENITNDIISRKLRRTPDSGSVDRKMGETMETDQILANIMNTSNVIRVESIGSNSDREHISNDKTNRTYLYAHEDNRGESPDPGTVDDQGEAETR